MIISSACWNSLPKTVLSGRFHHTIAPDPVKPINNSSSAVSHLRTRDMDSRMFVSSARAPRLQYGKTPMKKAVPLCLVQKIARPFVHGLYFWKPMQYDTSSITSISLAGRRKFLFKPLQTKQIGHDGHKEDGRVVERRAYKRHDLSVALPHTFMNVITCQFVAPSAAFLAL